MFSRKTPESPDNGAQVAAKEEDLSSLLQPRQDKSSIRAPLKPSIIGEGFEFIGTIKSEGVLNVVGIVRGKVSAKSVTVDVGGHIEGELMTESLMVKGTVVGEVACQDLNVGPRALVDGTIQYQSIHIQRGGKVSGKFIKA